MFDKPNVVIPLAASYNIRGNSAFTDTFTTGIDQRKINSIYTLITNTVTGRMTLYLCKRPGVQVSSESYGTTGQTAYLVVIKPGFATFSNDQVWVFSINGNDVRVSDSSGTTVILTAASHLPFYWDVTSISGTPTGIIQIRNISSEQQRVFYASDRTSWTEITDGDFTSLTIRGTMAFMDGYAFALSSTSRIYNSDLNTLASWGASSYITKQIKEDYPTTLARFKNQIIAAGASSFEVFMNKGTPSGSPLISVKELAQDYGFPRVALGGGKTHASIGNFLYFYGRPGNASRSFGLFAWNGSTVEKVSNPAIDAILGALPYDSTNNVFSVSSVLLYGQEAVSIALDPVTATTQRWLMFFPKWKEWFEWNSTVFGPVNSGSQFIGVGSNQHKVYKLYPDTVGTNNFLDDGASYTWTHQFQLPSSGNERKFMPFMALKGDTSRSAQSINVEFSDDDYQTFSAARGIDMTSKQKILTRCGSWQGQRAVRLSYSGANDVRLSHFLARIE